MRSATHGFHSLVRVLPVALMAALAGCATPETVLLGVRGPAMGEWNPVARLPAVDGPIEKRAVVQVGLRTDSFPFKSRKNASETARNDVTVEETSP